MLRRAIDAALGLVARLAVKLATRSLEVQGRDRIPEGRPVLVVSNHFNGFVDPLLLVAVLGRVPRFLAKSTLWKVVVARPFLALAGVIPVHRPSDGGGGTANDRTFADVEKRLVADETIAIFPEGTTHDEPRLQTVRTGAARIALGARAAGAEGLVVLPIGLLFEDKVALRTRVLARIGTPIVVDDEIDVLVTPGAPEDASNVELVRALTGLLTEQLQAVSPDYDDRWEHAELSMAAEVRLREGRARRQDPKLGDREELAQRMAHQGSAPVRAPLQTYAAHLRLLDVDDLTTAGGLVGLLSRLVLIGAALAAGFVLLVPGLISSIIPALLVAIVGAQPAAVVTKGTVRVLTGLVAFIVAWSISCYFVADTFLTRTVWLGYQITAAVLALPIIDATVRWWREARGWSHLRNLRGALPDLVADRDAVVRAVELTAPGQPEGS